MPEVFIFPISFAQERLWFLEQLEPGSSIYHIPTVVDLQGPVELSTFENALEEIVRRHESLRTTFATMDGEPVQVISAALSISVPLIDLSRLSVTEREQQAQSRTSEVISRPFDFVGEQLLRVCLLRVQQESHVLVMVLHHIVSDGWSSGVFMRELEALCSAYRFGRPSALPELTVQYPDFTLWQRELMQDETLDSQIAYWKSQLNGASVLELPTDRPRPATQSFRGATARFTCRPGLLGSLIALSKNHRVTPFMTLLCAFQTLLHRYTGQQDIVIGTPIAGRNRAETELLIGLFVNQLVIRADFSGDPRFSDLLAQVRETCLSAFAHQDFPFEKLVEVLNPERDLSRSPIVQVVFALQNAPLEGFGASELKIRPIHVGTGGARYDLSLSMTENLNELSGSIEYSTALFDDSTIELMISHLQQLLESIAETPDRRTSELSILSADERTQLIEWNQTASEYPGDKCIHEMVERQAAETPDRIALIGEGGSLTYRELDARANQLARHLSGLGVGPEVVVGVCLSRSVEMVVGLLGVLKAAGAYLPLDSEYPSERLSFMLEDADAPVLLTEERLQSRVGSKETKVVCLESDWEQVSRNSTTALAGRSRPDNIAYVIYTSGSTGRPKGVMIQHQSVLNFFSAMDARIRSTETGRWLALTSISFDISVLELLWTLARGFEVIIHPDQRSIFDPARSRRRKIRKPIQFSLFYFASDAARGSPHDRYKLLVDGARFADEHGFTAVWTPERHFHAFGDLYPNPAITSAAIAAITQRIQVRAGSVVLPLHNPVRVAEEWSMIDNLSHGRVGVSFASGWHMADFVLAPENYHDRRRVMIEQVDVVRRLWRGESLEFQGGGGKPVNVRMLPQPVQEELPVWLTAAGGPETFRLAGEIGANVLTHLLGQSLSELAEKISVYREARAQANYAGEGHVTLMLHTYVGEDDAEAKAEVRLPLKKYLADSVDLMANLARNRGMDVEEAKLTDDNLEALLDHAFERYYSTSGLMGGLDKCMDVVESVREIGVDEIACLIDFGVENELVMKSLDRLSKMKHRIDREQSEEAEPISEMIRREGVTHLQCTPSMAQMLKADDTMDGGIERLEEFLVGGEPISEGIAEWLNRLNGRTNVRNMYGPTETTIWSAMHQLQGEAKVPIGRPIANTKIYSLNSRLEQDGIGVAGELHIGGEGLARGYLKQPELTAQRFSPDPFSGEAGARMYRTGDIGRYSGEGTIEFLGRADQQVKLGGHRIELGEVEAVLSEHREVREAIVVTRGEGAEKRLVGYVVCTDGVSASELKQYLREKLPGYMAPGVIVKLEEMPLTANGKVDRKKLSQMKNEAGFAEAVEHEGPRNETEETLTKIWSEVLGVDRICRSANFFELGGNSMLAAQAMWHVRYAFQLEIPLRALFDQPTVAGLGAILESILQENNLDSASPDAEMTELDSLQPTYSSAHMEDSAIET